MTYNEFEGKPPRWDQPLYKDQTSGTQYMRSLFGDFTVIYISSQKNYASIMNMFNPSSSTGAT